jgi:hypothetical protein
LPHRELYTFFSTSGKSAIKRVELVDFGEAGTSTLVDFDVANAHCYSAEDEAKLRTIIESGGASAFNEMIREGMHNMVIHTRGQRMCSTLLFYPPAPPFRRSACCDSLSSIAYRASVLMCASTTCVVVCMCVADALASLRAGYAATT